jgi:predicted glycoside hydrolase/deacetylase ChbG (UPF0249 family)
MQRVLIVNADDLGASRGVNRGILEAHERGIVTSASLMVRGRAASEAAGLALELPGLAVGLHVDLGEWEFRRRRWRPVYEVVPLDDGLAVEAEVERQLARFLDLMGAAPTHLDSHQHVHRDEPVRGVLVDLAHRLSVPLRHVDERIRYCGRFYGQTGEGRPLRAAITPVALCGVLRSLPAGASELCCHPGYASDIESPYASEREREIDALCSPMVRATLQREAIALTTFRSFAGARYDSAGEAASGQD